MLFRGQPATDDEDDSDGEPDAKPKARRRKADDEYLIRRSLLDRRLVDAVIALPLNLFYGAGVPACLLILGKDRPAARRDNLLLVYAARHYGEQTTKNSLRAQDVMRILVHYHAYGDAGKAAALVAEHGARLKRQVDADRDEEVGRVRAEFEEKFPPPRATGAGDPAGLMFGSPPPVGERRSRARAAAEAEREEKVAAAEKRAAEKLAAIDAVGVELVKLYADPAELAKHARVVPVTEVEENEFKLNIPRYVDTFEPEAPIDVPAALAELDAADRARAEAEKALRELLRGVGYGG